MEEETWLASAGVSEEGMKLVLLGMETIAVVKIMVTAR